MANVFGVDVYRLDVENSAALGAALRAYHADRLAAGEPVVVEHGGERLHRAAARPPRVAEPEARRDLRGATPRLRDPRNDPQGSRADLLTTPKVNTVRRRVILSRLDQRGRKVRLVRRVRIVLRLQAEAAAAAVRSAALADQLAIEKIPRVELHARFRRSRRRACGPTVGSTTRAACLSPAVPAQHPVVIVALAVLDLRMRRVDARADRGGLAEVERRARRHCASSPVGISVASTGV